VRIQIQGFFFFYKVWSLETYLGYTAAILIRKCRVLTGEQRTIHEQRKRVMWIVFFDIEGIVRA
jgi:hypothetical protein